MRAVILDFGLARLKEGSKITSGLTVLGTPTYMSPEQTSGLEADFRSDIWALGCVLYEMIAGTPPFAAKYQEAVVYSILNEAPSPLTALRTGVPLEIDWIVEKCLAKTPEQRYQATSGLAIDLERARNRDGFAKTVGEPRLAPPIGARSRGWPARREIAAWFVAAAAIAVLVGYVRDRPSVSQNETSYLLQAPLFEKATIHSFSISPDGRRVAVAASGPQRPERRLWIRALDSSSLTELPDTEGARYPFWSPDSTSVGFFANAKLMRIGVEGGPPQPICDASDGRGASWGDSGLIVFAPDPYSTNIHYVPASGGTAVPIPVRDLRSNDSLRFPQMLPDQRHFIYSSWNPTSTETGVFWRTLDGENAGRIITDASNAVYVPSGSEDVGNILFVREGQLRAQPFDAETRTLRGEQFVVAEGVAQYGNRGYFGFSASVSGTLVYGTHGGISLREIRWYYRDGRTPDPVSNQALIGAVQLSPDEQRAVIGIDGGNISGRFDIWILELARGTKLRLTSHRSHDVMPRWSRAGDRVFFSSNRDGPFGLYEKSASGGEVSRLSASDLMQTNMWLNDYSPGEQVLALTIQSPETGSDLWAAPLEAEQPPFPVASNLFNEQGGEFSPNGKQIAFVSDETGRFEVYIQTFPEANRRWQVSKGGGSLPRWRGDGREIFYLAPDGTICAVDISPTDDGLSVSNPAPLFQSELPSYASQPRFLPPAYDVTADGRRFLVASSAPFTVITNWIPDGDK